MEIPIMIILLFNSYHILASEHSHLIPVENYETELQDLGEHVEYPETPVKVVKITKTIAVKVPVPYPVKVIEKVPYPVHVAKPYPVPVTQIVHVPQPAKGGKSLTPHEALDVTHGGGQREGQQTPGHYQVQKGHSYEQSSPESYSGISDYSNHFGISEEGHSSGGSSGNSYDAPHSFYSHQLGDSGDTGSYESKKYDQAVKPYFHKQGSSGSHYH